MHISNNRSILAIFEKTYSFSGVFHIQGILNLRGVWPRSFECQEASHWRVDEHCNVALEERRIILIERSWSASCLILGHFNPSVVITFVTHLAKILRPIKSLFSEFVGL